jgi:hypothetical protein
MGEVPGVVACSSHDVPVAGCGGCEVVAAREAWTAAESTLVRVTVAAVRSGALSQVAAARAAGVDRHTVRRWLGLPRRRPGRRAGSG